MKMATPCRPVASSLGLVAGLSATLIAGLCRAQTTLVVPGLERPVEILRDRWGIAHIYAETEHDLFFAQGYQAARDRLFQLELWRRQATGTVAELLGPRELKRDIGTRLFKFRKDLTQELAQYHPRGAAIVAAFVEGINAYIAEANRAPERLPLEFRLLGTRPQPWTPEVVISRHQGLLGNVTDELDIARAVALLGPERVKWLLGFGPGDPELRFDPAIDPSALSDSILEVYRAFRTPVRFQPADVLPAYRAPTGGAGDGGEAFSGREPSPERAGSNNWVIAGQRSESRYPLMANDPHRALSVPSLRYWVHLVGPGWDVVGAGEPALPGVAIGHNQYGAWGLTVFETDGEDLYVYRTNPADPAQYWYQGQWERMTVIQEDIPVKGQAPARAELKYTRHGPVVFEDRRRHLAYAVRAAWMEPGGAPYLASLRMDQARTWEEFREACQYANIPGENMVWAGRDGTIGWQAVGIAPIRRHFSGLIPVPGDGRYEWDGFLPIKAKPHVANPAEGFFATANNDLVPRDYPYLEAIGFQWADPYRWARIAEVLAGGRRFAVADLMALQTDQLAVPARQLVPLLKDRPAADSSVERARRRLLEWDYLMAKESVAAGIYAAWESALRELVTERLVPAAARPAVGVLPLSRIVGWLIAPPGELGANPTAARDSLLLVALATAVQRLRVKLGPDPEQWRWGQERYHHALLHHPLGSAVNAELRARLEVGPLPRGGYGSTVNQTGNGDNQTGGASFRIIVDTGDWDRTVGINTPGQSGDPDSPHYRDLFELWAADRYVPVFYSRPRVEAVTEERAVLAPKKPGT